MPWWNDVKLLRVGASVVEWQKIGKKKKKTNVEILIQPNIMGFVTTDKIGILYLEVRIEWHRGQFENSDKDSRDPSRFRHILLYIIY